MILASPHWRWRMRAVFGQEVGDGHGPAMAGVGQGCQTAAALAQDIAEREKGREEHPPLLSFSVLAQGEQGPAKRAGRAVGPSRGRRAAMAGVQLGLSRERSPSLGWLAQREEEPAKLAARAAGVAYGRWSPSVFGRGWAIPALRAGTLLACGSLAQTLPRRIAHTETIRRGTMPFYAHRWRRGRFLRGTIPNMGVLFRGTMPSATGKRPRNNSALRNNGSLQRGVAPSHSNRRRTRHTSV